MHQPDNLPHHRLRVLDALRGWAIVGVIFVHNSIFWRPDSHALLSLIEQGQRGVQLFYIISAFTLYLSYFRRSQDEISPVANFYIRRIFRIAPLW
jgi:peptidoglycan/LPS O-acetylase OafA/YrhL